MKFRGQWEGMVMIASFNWPYYLVAGVVFCGSLAGSVLFSSFFLKVLCGVLLVCAAWFLFGSLAASHFIYDRSDLYCWNWLDRALNGVVMRQGIFCHCGFDETSTELRERFRGTQWQVLDHYKAEQMTEASIRRARLMFPPEPGTLPSPYHAWPAISGGADVVFGLLAIHELRSEAERRAWFNESKRCLRKGGRVVLVEHVRDMANFGAFGPGFVHFHSVRSWRRCWEGAGLRLIDQFCVTPFVRVFVLGPA
jgi:hypothetical protein